MLIWGRQTGRSTASAEITGELPQIRQTWAKVFDNDDNDNDAFSHSFGYGVMDASGMVKMAQMWRNVGPQVQESIRYDSYDNCNDYDTDDNDNNDDTVDTDDTDDDDDDDPGPERGQGQHRAGEHPGQQ